MVLHMKTCKKCETSKKPTEFYKKKDNKDGLQSVCKPCQHHQRSVNAAKVAAKKEPPISKDGETPDHMKKHVYSEAIRRLHRLGLWSDKGAQEALERVQNLELSA